jgi:hypothetical protein
MNYIKAIYCIALGVYNTIEMSSFMSGHDFAKQDNGDLKCSVCGCINHTSNDKPDHGSIA